MARLRAMARTDGLLGIANRAHFHERLEQVCALALRGERPVGVLMVDVDCFKALNDHYGHLHGDARLQKLPKPDRLPVPHLGFGGPLWWPKSWWCCCPIPI